MAKDIISGTIAKYVGIEHLMKKNGRLSIMMKHGHLSHVRLSLVLIVAIFFSPLMIEKGLGQELPAYAPGSLIIKFTELAVDQKDYRFRIEDGRIVTGLRNVDILGTRFGATSFNRFYFELFDPVEDRKMGKDRMFFFQFPAAADMENIANAYGNNPNIEEAHPNYLYYATITPNDT